MYVKIPDPNTNSRTEFNTSKALSCQMYPTMAQPEQPIKDSTRSYIFGTSSTLRHITANSITNDAIHLIYQSRVCKGVIFLYTLVELRSAILSSSFLSYVTHSSLSWQTPMVNL